MSQIHAARDLAMRDRGLLVRAIIASCAGTTIDYYDFLLYNIGAALYFGRLFFPGHDPFLSTLAAFGTLIPGYIARPIGALLFGHFGDRAGRKAMLIVTLVMMGAASAGVGLVPTYAQVGIWAPILLVILRILQGLGVSGEWGGAVLIGVEWQRSRHRGLAGAFAQVGIPAGILLSQLAFVGSTLAFGRDSYWGWRVPFLVSVVLVVLGLYVRLGILETPAFTKVLEARRRLRWPAAAILRSNLGTLALCFLACIAPSVTAVLFSTFILTYAVQFLGLQQPTIQGFVLIGSAVSIGTALLWGHISDQIGRRRMYAIGCLVLIAFSFLYWWLLDTRVAGLVLVAVVLSFGLRDMVLGPQAAFMAESFPTPLRYTGAGLSFNLGSAAFSGTTPAVALILLHAFHSSLAVGMFMAAGVLLALVGALLLPDRSRQSIDEPGDRAADLPELGSPAVP